MDKVVKTIGTMLLSTSFLLCPAIAVAADGAKTSGDNHPPNSMNAPQMSASKKAVIKELITTTQADKHAKMMVDMILKSQQEEISLIEQKLGSSMTPEQKARADKLLATKQHHLMRFRQLFDKEIDMAEAMDTMFYAVYDKYFTEPELKDLVAFYRTPTGIKAVNTMPQLSQEIMAMSNQLLTSKVMQIEEKILREDKAAASGGVDASSDK